jgi:hypothetical protein
LLPAPFDLHVLSTPPAFVLSQNQTLRKELNSKHVDSGINNARYRNAQKKYLTMPDLTPAKKPRELMHRAAHKLVFS